MIYAAVFLSISMVLLILLIGKYFGPGGSLEKESQLKQRISKDPNSSSPELEVRKKYNVSDVKFLSDFLNRHNAASMGALLKTAKLTVSVSVFLLGSAVAGFVTFLLLKDLLPFILAVGAGLLVAYAPYVYLRTVRNRYLQKFDTYLPDTLGIISNSIKVGHGLETAMTVVAKSAPYPLCNEFQTLQAEIQLGINLQTALNNLQKRIGSSEFKIFITGITVHQELGGNLSEILDNLQKTIRERFALTREIKTLSAQGIISAWVLFCIPFFFVGMWLVNDPKIFLGFVNSPPGRTFLTGCGVLQVISFFWIRSIINIKD